jgi:hypothetical protein
MPLCRKQSRRSRDAPIIEAGTNIALGTQRTIVSIRRIDDISWNAITNAPATTKLPTVIFMGDILLQKESHPAMITRAALSLPVGATPPMGPVFSARK